MSSEIGWNRRGLLGGAALLALVIGVPSGVALLSRVDEDELPSERQREMLREVAQLVIPATQTPGAGDVGVGDFVILALAHGLDGTRQPAASAQTPPVFTEYRRRDGSLCYVDWLEATLDRAVNGDWLGKAPERRRAILAAVDAQAFEKQPVESPWRKIKGLILTGYYTSQAGGSRELQFELVPGRYDPKVPLAPGARAFSSDWTAVDFG